jgi:hypothetical protein
MAAECNKVSLYNNDREQTIISHHNRIEQLRESYAKKLETSERTCKTVGSPTMIVAIFDAIFLRCR